MINSATLEATVARQNDLSPNDARVMLAVARAPNGINIASLAYEQALDLAVAFESLLWLVSRQFVTLIDRAGSLDVALSPQGCDAILNARREIVRSRPTSQPKASA